MQSCLVSTNYSKDAQEAASRVQNSESCLAPLRTTLDSAHLPKTKQAPVCSIRLPEALEGIDEAGPLWHAGLSSFAMVNHKRHKPARACHTPVGMEMPEQVHKRTTIVLHDTAEPLFVRSVPELSQVPRITAVNGLGTDVQIPEQDD